MNLPSPLPAEGPEPQPVTPTTEDSSIQPAADQPSKETQQQPVDPASEDISTPPTPLSDQPSEETQQQPIDSTADDTTQPPTSTEPVVEETEPQLAASSEADGADGVKVSEKGEDEFAEDDEYYDDYDDYGPEPAGVFIRRWVLITAASVIVVAALLASFLVVNNRPKDPPTDWIATYTPPAGSSSTSKVLYYLHWTNQNGSLKGQMQLAAIANGAPQALTVPATGLYNRDNHMIYVVVVINGQADTLTGKINDANDTLSLNPAGATDQSSQFVFHTGSANDFKQDTKKLVSVP